MTSSPQVKPAVQRKVYPQKTVAQRRDKAPWTIRDATGRPVVRLPFHDLSKWSSVVTGRQTFIPPSAKFFLPAQDHQEEEVHGTSHAPPNAYDRN